MRRPLIKGRLPDHILALMRRMTSAAMGPLVSFVVLLALPLCGAALLPTEQFAVWTILSTITTVALSLDFGGVALTSARFGTVSPVKLIFQASALSSVGSLIVGVASALLWIPYSSTAAANAFGFGEGLAAISLCTIAAVFRSTLAVLAQAALHLDQTHIRTLLTAGQAFLCFGISLVLLIVTPSAWALPIGWAVSSLVVLLLGLIWMKMKGAFQRPVVSELHPETSTFTFVWSRTFASLLGSAILQGDRWVVGAVAGPEFLAAYEVAWRVAVLPRFLVQNLAIAVSGDAGHLYRTAPRKIKSVLSSSTKICLVIAVLSSGAVSVFYFYITEPLGVDSYGVVYFVLLGAFTFIGITAPLSFLAVAIGLPALDIPYLVLTVIVSTVAGVISSYLGSVSIFVIGNGIAISVGALWYLYYGNRAVIRRCRLAARTARRRMLESVLPAS
jgi:O-antigen/teichoic acid export membrane protein